MLCLALTACLASSETFGAMITSQNWFLMILDAVSPSSSRLKAMIPPNADSLSVAKARS